MADKTEYENIESLDELLNRTVPDTEKQKKNSFDKNIKNSSAFGGRGAAGSTILSSRDKMILAAKATVFWHTYYKIKRRVDPEKDDKGETKTPVSRVIDKFDKTKKAVKDLTKKGGILATLAKLALAVAAIFALPEGYRKKLGVALKNIAKSLGKFMWEDVLKPSLKALPGLLGKGLKGVWDFIWSEWDADKLQTVFGAAIIGALAIAFVPGGAAVVGLAAAIITAITMAVKGTAALVAGTVSLATGTAAAAAGTAGTARTAGTAGLAASSGVGRNPYRGLIDPNNPNQARVPRGGLNRTQARSLSRVTGKSVTDLMKQRPGSILPQPITTPSTSTASRVASRTARTTGGALKVLGKIAAPIAGVTAAYEEQQKNKDLRRTVTKGIGVGGGIAAGAALGSAFLPVVGTVVGGIVGGLAGWWGGSKGADAINKELFPTAAETRAKEQQQLNELALSETGGHIAIQQLNETKISNIILQNIATLTEQILMKPNGGGGVTMPAQRPVPIGGENKNSPMSYPSGMENYLNSAYANS